MKEKLPQTATVALKTLKFPKSINQKASEDLEACLRHVSCLQVGVCPPADPWTPPLRTHAPTRQRPAHSPQAPTSSPATCVLGCLCCCCCCLVAESWSSSFVTPWTVAHQTPLSIGFPRQEYWSGLPLPPPGDLPDPGIKPASPAL